MKAFSGDDRGATIRSSLHQPDMSIRHLSLIGIVSDNSLFPEPADRDGDPSARRWDRFAIAAIVGGAVLRAAWTLAAHPPFDYVYSDMGGYVDRAKRLAEGGPFERFDTFYPPGTHVLLSVPYRIFGTGRAGDWAGAVLWVLLSCAIPYLVWRIARRLIGVRAGAVAAALAAAWPLFVAYTGYFLSEIPSIAILLTTILLGLKTAESSGRRRMALAVLTGVAGGVSIVMRPQLGLNVLIVGWVLLRSREKRLRIATAAAAGLLVPLIGIVSLNWAILDKPTVSENAAVNFFHAHCPVLTSYYGQGGKGYYWFAAPPSVELNRGRDYVFPNGYPTEQGFLFREAIRCARNDGIKHVGVMIRNVAEMGLATVPWPPSNERDLRRFVRPANVLYSVALPIIVVSAFVVMRRKRTLGHPAGEGVLLAHLAPMIPMGALFVGDPRYRMAYDAFGLALAAALLIWVADAMRDRRSGASAADAPQAGVTANMVEN